LTHRLGYQAFRICLADQDPAISSKLKKGELCLVDQRIY